ESPTCSSWSVSLMPAARGLSRRTPPVYAIGFERIRAAAEPLGPQPMHATTEEPTMPPSPTRRARRTIVSGLVAAGAVLPIAGCTATVDPVPHNDDGWSSVHADGHGSNAVEVDGPRTLDLQWNRGLGA